MIGAAMAETTTPNLGYMEHHTVASHLALSDGRTQLPMWGGSVEDRLHISPEDMYGDDKVEDVVMWVDQSRKLKGYTAHVNNLKWEVIVVDEDIMNTFCLPGDKIVVYTGLLKHFPSDAEIATVLGYEVGHVVARHVAEKLTQGIWLGFVQLILSFIYVPGLVRNTSKFLRLPFSRRMESEADHIGLMLMAAAGYDPRLAPAFNERMGQLHEVPEFLQYICLGTAKDNAGEIVNSRSYVCDFVENLAELEGAPMVPYSDPLDLSTAIDHKFVHDAFWHTMLRSSDP